MRSGLASSSATVTFETAVSNLFPDTHAPNVLEELLLSGGDDRTYLDPATGRNSYHVGPFVLPDALVRSSCTCNPLTPLASQVAQRWQRQVLEAEQSEFSAIMEVDVRGAIARHLQLPDGCGVITAPSGTDIELIPVMMAKSFYPQAERVRVMVAAMNEIGKGVALAAGGRHSSKAAPLADESILAGRSFHQLSNTEDVSSTIRCTELDARDSEGRYIDHSETIAKEMAEARAVGEPTVVHTVYGTKTNKREPFPEGTGCDEAKASTIVVVDACQGRYSRAEISALLDRGAVITITGSKAWSGPPFSGAVLLPPALMSRLRNVPEADLWIPDMLAHYFTQDDFPTSLPACRARLPRLQNRGLALRWLAAIGEFEAYLAAGGDSDDARAIVAQWSAEVSARIERDHPQISVFEVNDSIINITVASSEGAPMAVSALRKVYALLTEDVSAALSAAGVSLSAEQEDIAQRTCLIGQPVKICDEFGIIRLALGCPDIRMLMQDRNVALAVNTDEQILRKISLISKYAAELEV
ncbi:hypothetical protein CYMTET_48644 [Cymbomonas tetramitiformis]|uniref:Uncharacterized protein n=1 Tax=Cymbomonas tetramitiformis TaxID=36881 RepID=A0AAE0BRZ1_9CHLO|nr:hypothetical protein CYMTET_48644 [Cymbomonas tetramitiformis]